ncbi:MAG: PD-(D/E)XK nuclease family protein, partial [Candidatus Hodarchaeales archaeon]
RSTVSSIFLQEINRFSSTEEIDIDIAGYSSQLSLYNAGRRIMEGKTNDPPLPRISTHDINNIVDRINIEAIKRQGPHDSEYDAYLTGNSDITGFLSEKYGKDYPFSVSRLETYAYCHFKFYLQHVLKLLPPEELEDDPVALITGSLVHEVLYEFFTENKDINFKTVDNSTANALKERMRELGKKRIEKMKRRSLALEAQVRKYIGDDSGRQGILAKVIDKERAPFLEKFKPAHFEHEIGSRRSKEGQGGEPLKITLASDPERYFLFHGIIDRIDVSENGEHFIVIDYKTGWTRTWTDINQGRSFQLPLYIVAAQLKLKQRGVAGLYYALKDPTRVAKELTIADVAFKGVYFKKKRYPWKNFQKGLESVVEAALNVIEAMRNGVFTPNADITNCSRYCDYGRICRHEPAREIE